MVDMTIEAWEPGQRVRKGGAVGTIQTLRGRAKRDGCPRFAFVEWDGDDGYELERLSDLS